MATSKLTLSMDTNTIQWAKKYVEGKNISLSKFIQNQLNDIAEKEEKQSPVSEKLKTMEISDWVKAMVLVDGPTPDFDHKAEYGKHLEEKYGI